jgi:hypothetical protein
LPFGGVHHTVADESRQRFLVEMLQLAPAAGAEMAARRNGVVRSRQQCAVGANHVSRRRKWHMAPRRGDAVALGGDADDLFRFAHSAAA